MDEIKRYIEPIYRKLRNLFSRGIVNRVDDSKDTQKIQCTIYDDDTVDTIDRYCEYGFISNPKSGAKCVVLFTGGSRGDGVVIGTDDPNYRVKNLTSGQVCIYDASGTKIVLGNNGKIDIYNASTITVHSGDVLADGISLKNHVHGGVETGTSQTGKPQ